jgi:hypothetical protein
MSLTIEQIEELIASLQQTLDNLKNQKLKVSRNFSGKYFEPYHGRLYRRMESEGVPIWETYLEIKKEWVILETKGSQELEKVYSNSHVSESKEESLTESLEEFME